MNHIEINSILEICSARTVEYKKGEYIFNAESTISDLGIVLKGRIQIENNDFWGNRTIIDSVEEGNVFAETYAITQSPLMIDVCAVEESSILFLSLKPLFVHDIQKLQKANTDSLLITRFAMHILKISAQKNLHLSMKIFNISSKTIRGRLISYLSQCAAQNKSNKFSIPFNRQELADYLCVDRSALSAELSKMKSEGLLDVWKNNFSLSLP